MSESFLGEIALFAFNNVPDGWLPCEGQQLTITQNQALYSLLGRTYGGDGATYFNLPDLRGRTPVHYGLMQDATRILPAGQVLTMGASGGTETVTLNLTQVPAHSHQFTTVSTNPSASTVLANATLSIAQKATTTAATAPNAPPVYAAPGALVTLNTGSLAPAGSSQAHENRQPYLALQYCICKSGLYPTRN